MNFLENLADYIAAFSSLAWGTPLLVLLLGGGLFFTLYSRFLPFRYFKHGVDVIRGKYDDPDAPGDVNHFQALSSALAATVGMGNISGVALAIAMGGPGAIFWMWVSAFFGMATKFFTCTLAIMYRGEDSAGQIQGGPMYVIEKGLGKSWKPLAVFFSIACMLGASPLFQANQLTQIIKESLFTTTQATQDPFYLDLGIGIFLAVLVSLVVFGGIRRIGNVAGRLVPFMVVLYFIAVLYILLTNYTKVPASFWSIIEDAFTGEAVLGGAVGAVIIAGARRAAFSNEAGIGTAPLAHGAARTKEPVREGLVAMLGPAIDTLLVCTLTALAILVTDAWQMEGINGVTMTLNAFESAIPGIGGYLLLICVLVFSLTTLFTYSYYGTKSLSYLTNVKVSKAYNHFYVLNVIIGAIVSVPVVVNFIDGMFAMMAIPTMVSALLLAPRVKKAAGEYFAKLQKQEVSKKDQSEIVV